MARMKFNFKISKWANFYFFVQNLSEWHFSNRKNYNIFWRKMLGVFSKQEKNALKEFKKIRLKYSESKSCFERSFYLSNDPFKKLSRDLPLNEYKNIKNIFYLFKDKFEILYKKELPLLKQWQKNLHKIANNKKITNKILISLNILYKTSIKQKTVDIYLLFSTPGGTGGGANINNKSISLEVSNYPKDDVNHVLGIIWHEIIHLFFQKKYFHPLLKRYFLNDYHKFGPINERVTASLFPSGVLGKRILKNKSIPIVSYSINISPVKQILDLTREYLDQKKYFDKEYIKKIDYLFFGSQKR